MKNMNVTIDAHILRAELFGSFLKFCQVFYPLVTARPFHLSSPIGRESHFITIARELTLAKKLQVISLLINVPPGHGKSVLICLWIAWTLAEFPDSQYLYISYGHELAAKHTEFVRRIVMCPQYGALFNVFIRHDIKAKDHFMTTAGGSVKAFGSAGAIVGFDAGLPNQNRFTGAVLCDDLLKVDEAHSDSIRNNITLNYRETILQRPRAPNVPIICIAQRLHEDDVYNYMLSGEDERAWKSVILQALDKAGNPLYPEVNPLEQLLKKKEKNPYVFSSQFQQEPVPSGGALFKEKDFPLLDEEPEFLVTFITVDTAETSKTYNDASVFSFWGLYHIADFGQKVEEFALHWIDCWEFRIEPKELEDHFKSFWSECMLHKCKPRIAAIERKSTGVTLCSVLSDMRGLEIRDVKRTKADGSKANRYIEMQPIIASKLISFTRNARHFETCKKHMVKITANMSHAHDDICFVAGTQIATLFGYKRIENITTTDFVITPFGLGRVTACGATGMHPVITRSGLTGTGAHPIFDDGTFKPLDSLYDAVELNLLSLKGLIKWKYQNLLNLMETNILLLARADITSIATRTLRGNTVGSDCMWQFGNLIRAGKYAKATSFTTKMATILITTLATWIVFRISNTCKNMPKKSLSMASPRLTENTSTELGTRLKSGTRVMRGKSGIDKMLSQHIDKMLSQHIDKMLSQHMAQGLKSKLQHALYAVKNLFIQGLGLSQQLVVSSVIPSSTDVILETLPPNVSYVNNNLQQRSITHNPEIEKPAPNLAQVSRAIVYNLTVDTYGVYYANNILVSNCDTAYDAVKIALIDKTLYARDIRTETQKTTSRLNAEDFNRRLAAIKAARGY